MRARCARADNHVIAAVELFQQRAELGGIVLPVAIHERDDVAGGRARAGLDRGAVAETLGMPDDRGARRFRNARGIVGRAVVNDDDLGIGIGVFRTGDGSADGAGLVLGGDDDR